MPRSIKAFVWLSVAYIAWGLFWNFHLLIWPTAHYLEVQRQLLAQTPPADRAFVGQTELISGLTKTLYFLLAFTVFAVLVAAFRLGWARWGVRLSLLVTETGLLCAFAYSYLMRPDSISYAMHSFEIGCRATASILHTGYFGQT